jgi:hypothetical protein
MMKVGHKSAGHLGNISRIAGGALFGSASLLGHPERLYHGKANLLSAHPAQRLHAKACLDNKSMANLLKNAPKRSEFSGAGIVPALSLSLSLSQ